MLNSAQQEDFEKRFLLVFSQRPMIVGGLPNGSSVSLTHLSTLSCAECDKYPLLNPQQADRIGGFSDQAVLQIGCTHWICISCYFDTSKPINRVCTVC